MKIRGNDDTPGELLSFLPAIEKGMDGLLKLDPVLICANTVAEYEPNGKRYTLLVLGERCALDLGEGTIHYPRHLDGHTGGALAVLVTHYLAGGKPIDTAGRLISYRELPDGMVFYGAFRRNAIEPIPSRFGTDMKEFETRAKLLGGRRVEHGEMGFEFDFFPRVPGTYVLWSGDDEVPASANILFDATAPYQLHTEDLAEVGEVITHLLCDDHGDHE